MKCTWRYFYSVVDDVECQTISTFELFLVYNEILLNPNLTHTLHYYSVLIEIQCTSERYRFFPLNYCYII